MKRNKTLVLFGYDWDRIEFRKLSRDWPQTHSGFDLFSFPSNARLAWFDMDRFSSIAAIRAKLQGARAVVSNHEQFGTLCAALVAEKLRLPGTSVNAVLACQHKLYAREILERVSQRFVNHQLSRRSACREEDGDRVQTVSLYRTVSHAGLTCFRRHIFGRLCCEPGSRLLRRRR